MDEKALEAWKERVAESFYNMNRDINLADDLYSQNELEKAAFLSGLSLGEQVGKLIGITEVLRNARSNGYRWATFQLNEVEAQLAALLGEER